MIDFLMTLVNLLFYEAILIFLGAMWCLGVFGFIVFIAATIKHWKSTLRAASVVLAFFVIVLLVSSVTNRTSAKKEPNQTKQLYKVTNNQ